MKSISREQALQLVEEGSSQSSEERLANTNERLRDLVLYAKEHSPYFKDAYQDIGDAFTLQDLPVTSKKELKECFDRWVTDPEITEEGLRAFLLDLDNVNTKYLGRYTALTTSGTTGNPMPMVRDEYHNIIHGLLLEKRLFNGVEANLLSSKVASIITTTGGPVSSYSSALRLKKQLGEHADRFLILSVLSPIEEIVEKLNAFQPEMLTGYPSILIEVAREQLEGRLSIAPEVVASSAEKMSHDAFETLREAFNCRVLNNYCSTEGGEIAMSCPQGNLHLNEDWILLEPVDADLQPVEMGEWSSGVLITDLTNYVQPIIRYHEGDCIRFSSEPCCCGSPLPVIEISGRTGDDLLLNGRQVPFLVLYVALLDAKNLASWQIVQIGEAALQLRFVESQGAPRQAVGEEACELIQQFLKTYGCGTCTVTTSDEVFFRNSKGGKAPYIISEGFDQK